MGLLRTMLLLLLPRWWHAYVLVLLQLLLRWWHVLLLPQLRRYVFLPRLQTRLLLLPLQLR